MNIKSLARTRELPFFNRNSSNRNILRLRDRGVFQSIFPENAANTVTFMLNAGPQTVYSAFDPCHKLHVGNLLVLINLLHWQRGGHQPIALIGGATAKIDQLSRVDSDLVSQNATKIKSDLERIFDNHQKYFWKTGYDLKPLMILNNEDWYKDLPALQMLGNVGRYVNLDTLINRFSMDNRPQRLAGMNFAEFSYQLFHAYDWLHLYKTYGCSFQIGGNEKMANMLLGQKLITGACSKSVYGFRVPNGTQEIEKTFPRPTDDMPTLSPGKTSAYNLHQFFLRQSKSEAEQMLKLFTFDEDNELEDLMRRHIKNPELRLPQKHLADQVVKLVHGKDAVAAARDAIIAICKDHIATFVEKNHVDQPSLTSLFQNATIVEIPPEPGQNVLDLTVKAGCFSNKEDAVKMISDGKRFKAPEHSKNPKKEAKKFSVHKLANNATLLRIGERNYYIVK